jgi:hypothetical protein
MLNEITAIEANKTWALIDPPLHYRPIRLLWVFKVMKDIAVVISKYKGWWSRDIYSDKVWTSMRCSLQWLIWRLCGCS